MEQFEYKEQYSKLSGACLNLTDACNLRCKYCFVEQNPHFMTLDIAKDSVNFLVQNYYWKKEHLKASTFNNKIGITYFGGEPTLMWDSIIVPLTTWIKNSDFANLVELSITTNGTLLDNNKIDFLKTNKIFPLLSIDGAEYTQNINRPTHNCSQKSFDLVYKNIPYLLKNFPNTTFRSTIDQATVDHTFENYIFAIANGFNNIFMMPNGREVWTEENKLLLKQEVEKIFWFIANAFETGHMPPFFKSINNTFIDIRNRDIATLKHITEKPNQEKAINRCGLGMNFGSIGYDGKIYGCQEQDSKFNADNIFYIGDIYNGIDQARHTKLLTTFKEKEIATCDNIELCTNCKLKNICTPESCPSTSWDLFQNFNINNEMHCYWKQCLFDSALVIMKYLTDKNNQLFKDYLNTQCGYKKYIKECNHVN